MNGAQLRVVKIGGSLLDMPDLVERLRSWSDQQLELGPLWFLVGGGTVVEQIRIDHQHGRFTESAAHWASIAVMRENTAELAQRFQGSRRLRVSGNLRRVTYPAAADTSRIQDDDRIEFVDVEPFLRGQATDPKVPPLPCSWDVTSDSIAALIAAGHGAAECVLLKSRLPAAGLEASELARDGYVDPFFPNVAAHLRRIRFVDFRSDGFFEVHWENGNTVKEFGCQQRWIT